MLLTTPTNMSEHQFATLIRTIVAKHDSLRLQFDLSAIAHYQAFDSRMIEIVELDKLERQQLSELCQQYQASLDIHTGPLLKAVYFKVANGPGRLLLAIHHLNVDGVSWRILLDDLRACWQQLELQLEPQRKSLQTNQSPPVEHIVLGDKTHSVRQWQQALKQVDFSAELAFWQAQLACEPLMFCHSSNTHQSTEQSSGQVIEQATEQAHVEGLTLSLDKTSTKALLSGCHQAYNTNIEELLLAALLKANIDWSGQSTLAIELESHGRETAIADHQLDLSETVGWLTALYPLMLELHPLALNESGQDWPNIINSVKTRYRQIPNKGIGFGVLKYLQGEKLPQPHRGILFNYLGQLDSLAHTDGEFTLAPEPSGAPVSYQNKPANPITINAQISDGCLQLTIHSDTSVLAAQKAAQFTDCYRQALYQCIEHCSHAKPSRCLADFTNARIDEQTLQQWLKAIPNVDKIYPITPMQQGILFHFLLDGHKDNDSDIYTIQNYGDLRGPLDIDAFQSAWQQVLDRHDVLRTSFIGLGSDIIHQLVQTNVKLPFSYIDSQDNAFNDTVDENWLKAFRAQDKAQGFTVDDHKAIGQLISWPLMRISVISLGQNRWHFVWTYHHVLLDGWSLPRIFNEVMTIYQGLVRQDQILLPTAANYENYIGWLNGRNEQQSYQFWQGQLAGYETGDPFADIKQGPLDGEYILYEKILSPSISAKLKTIAQHQRCTMNVLLQAAWGYLVHRYSGFDDIVFGATVSGRPSEVENVEQMVGLFINSIPIRLQFSGLDTIEQLLADLQKNNVRREEHSFVSLAQIQKQANLAPTTALFESLLAFENYPLSENNGENNSTVSDDDIIAEYLASDEQTSFPLSLMAYVAKLPQGEQLHLKFGFYAEQFNPQTMEKLFGHLQQLLSALAKHGAQLPLSQWQLLPDDEYQTMVYGQNQQQIEHPVQATVAQLFERIAVNQPKAIGISAGTAKFNYQSINTQANRLAHALLKAGLNKGDFVGLHLGRSPWFIIASIAVFKAGGAYVPLDPNYPAERINYIINDADMQLIVTDGPLKVDQHNYQHKDNDQQNNQQQFIDINTLASDLPDTNPDLALNGNDLAYMIYTSGTTGNPKGVMIEHGGFINSVYEQLRIMAFNQHSRVLAYASWNFDASVIEIFDALLAGGTLVLADEQQVQSPQLLTELLINEKVTHATIPPAILPFLDPNSLPLLQHLMAAGEHCPMTQVKRWSKNRVFYNGFGPTEASVCFSVTPYSGGEFTMGKAINNKQSYVVDEQLRLVPQGVAGELLIGGSGLARGYHNLPTLTAQKFIANHFIDNGSKLYRSGDRVKQLANGELMFLGRIDNQVKIRGHRIEIGEIESRSQLLPQVKAAAITVKQTEHGKQLLAAIVPQQLQSLELWPSVAEFYIYDDLLYRAMATDTRRINAFKGAINAAVKDKVVLEVGPGNELLLTQMCVKAGASKIYAVELMEQTYQSAKNKLAQLSEQDPTLKDKIVLIHGDATKVQLPEKADYCVSGIVGSIGGSEGAAKIINEVRHQLHNPANMIPKRTVTNLAAINLDDSAFKITDSGASNSSDISYGFSPIAAHYTNEVFQSLGKSFDLRVCLKNFKQTQMVSSIDVMESLDHSALVPLEASHQMRLEITKAGRFHGFAAWLNLYTDDDHIMDILESDQSLLPIYLPVSLDGIAVDVGDVITGTMTRTLHHNGLNPNYRFDAHLHKANGEQVDVGFITLHETDNFCATPFYQRLFNQGKPQVLAQQPGADVLVEVKNQLAEQLPSYMVPSLYTEVEALPLTANGKVDYQAIAKLAVSSIKSSDYQAPRNPIETELCNIFQDALNTQAMSINDNFFAAGGDSIIAIGVVAKARSLDLHLSVADIFEYSTIAQLAPIVAANQAASIAPQQSCQGEVPLWPIAEHFFAQQLPDSHHFNQSVMVNTPAEFDEAALRTILKALIERHDSLRLVFDNLDSATNTENNVANINGRFVPLNEDFIDQCIIAEPLTEQMLANRQQITLFCNEWQNRFDLNQGPLLRAILLTNSNGGEGKLCIIAHHLIIDGVSWRILLSDLHLAWQQYIEGANTQGAGIKLAAKTHSIVQWRQALTNFANNIDQDERDYWLAQLQKPAPQHLRQQKNQISKGIKLQSCELTIPADATSQLTGPCNDAYLTRINELLLAALHQAWRKWCGESVLPLAMESHGRETIGDIDLSETIGWFTALYPQRLEISLDSDLTDTINQIKTQYRQLPNNGIGFGLLKHIDKDAQINQLDKPLACEVVFNYLGQMDQALGDDGPFADARLATGYNSSPSQPMAQLLAINGMIQQGQLSFSISFDSNQLAIEDAQHLRDGFKQALLDIITHCHNKIDNNQLFEQNSDLIVSELDSMLDDGIEI